MDDNGILKTALDWKPNIYKIFITNNWTIRRPVRVWFLKGNFYRLMNISL